MAEDDWQLDEPMTADPMWFELPGRARSRPWHTLELLELLASGRTGGACRSECLCRCVCVSVCYQWVLRCSFPLRPPTARTMVAFSAMAQCPHLGYDSPPPPSQPVAPAIVTASHGFFLRSTSSPPPTSCCHIPSHPVRLDLAISYVEHYDFRDSVTSYTAVTA